MKLHVLGRPGSDLLSRDLSRSTIGAEGVNGRVRNGIGWGPLAKATRPAEDVKLVFPVGLTTSLRSALAAHPCRRAVVRSLSCHPCSAEAPPRAARRHRLVRSTSKEDGHGLMRVIKPIELLVPVSYTCRHASTPGLSTWSSSTALKGELVSRWVSRLDAFSGYPVRT